MDYKSEILDIIQKLKEKGYNKICFWLPTYNVGGGSYYFCELAKYLSQNTFMDIYYVDYREGYASQLLEDTNVKIIEYNENEKNFPITDKSIIVVNSTRVIQLKQMNKDNKILFWHYESTPCAWHALFLKGEYMDFFKLCRENNAMLFHDWAARNSFKQQYNFIFDKKLYLHMYLPQKTCVDNPHELINDNEINITWLGRISHDKIHSLFYLIDNLSKYQTERKKVLHIVGDGLCMDLLKKYSNKYSKEIQFDIVGTVRKEYLVDYLKENTDILFAMGLSCIEGAALKIPTAIVLLDSKPIKSDKFFWLYNTKEYCVGITPNQQREFNIEYSHFKEMLDAIYIDNQKGYIAEKCYMYYLENMSDYDKLVCNFLRYIDQCTLTMEKLEACIKYIPYNHIKVKRIKLLNKVLYEDIINKEEFGQL